MHACEPARLINDCPSIFLLVFYVFPSHVLKIQLLLTSGGGGQRVSLLYPETFWQPNQDDIPENSWKFTREANNVCMQISVGTTKDGSVRNRSRPSMTQVYNT